MTMTMYDTMSDALTLEEGAATYGEMQWASVGTSMYLRAIAMKSLEQRFNQLRDQWLAQTIHYSSLFAAMDNSNYLKILGLGQIVVPLMLKDLRDNRTHWFVALHQLTGANPVRPESAGIIEEMSNDWVSWGELNGWI